MNQKQKLLLHTCCAPCLTVAQEKLRPNFDLTVFWYNPNIEPEAEHKKRFNTLTGYLEKIDLTLIGRYDYAAENKKWHQFIKGLENEPEGGRRCAKCFEFRLHETLKNAKELGYEIFTTTLTTSPFKDTNLINSIGSKSAIDSAVAFQINQFGKDGGYQRSIESSKQYGLYRQKYCGCQYSNQEQT